VDVWVADAVDVEQLFHLENYQDSLILKRKSSLQCHSSPKVEEWATQVCRKRVCPLKGCMVCLLVCLLVCRRKALLPMVCHRGEWLLVLVLLTWLKEVCREWEAHLDAEEDVGEGEVEDEEEVEFLKV